MKFQNYILLFIAAATCLLTLACNSNREGHHQQAAKLLALIGSEDFNAIANAKKISVSDIRTGIQSNLTAPQKKTELSNGTKNELIQILTHDQSYILDRTKKCLFVPEYAFEFEGKTPLLILFSPSCKQIKMIKSSGSVTLDIDPTFNELMMIINRQLPNDEIPVTQSNFETRSV